MSIKFKLIISYLVLIIFTVGVLGLLIADKSKKALFNEVTENSYRITELMNTTLSVRNDLLMEKAFSDTNYASDEIKNLGEVSIHEDEFLKIGDGYYPSLYAGKTRLSLNGDLVSDLKKNSGALVTIHLLDENKLIRVATMLENKNGSAVGTCITSDSEIYQKIIKGEEYEGVITFGGETYITRVKPLFNNNKKVVGAIGLGNKILNDYLEKSINAIKFGKSGYLYIIDRDGVLKTHPTKKGESLGEFDYCKQMLKNKSGTIEYEFNGMKKFASYRYFEPWNWYIVATATHDDLNYTSKTIMISILIVGLIIIVISTALAIIIANNLSNPLKKLKDYMEIASKGDLSIRSDIDSKDEIGILSKSFNNMITVNNRLLEETVKYDKLKNEFMANMSHELKTPLNIIFSTAQLFSLYAENTDTIANKEKLNNYIDTIKQNCYRLLRLVNNLIDITKIDSGFMELNLKNDNIVAVVEEITLSTAKYVENMNREIIFDTEIEEKIMAIDEEKMERILLNLISNAIKFTDVNGVIEVNIYDRITYIVIEVKDNGRGIPESELSNIFERFKQVDPLLSRSHEGSGIGLSMVKSLVEMHKGEIRVESKYKEGTNFKIYLPVNIEIKEDEFKDKEKLVHHTNVEKIQIEFSDIYK
ncbi:Signal transduction histidine kinase [Clostridium cavendishii DSM 21758]|uniref:histidine kinase n=1 Tax=Clostridium cavendishii DSM 21758 TaxID=1121302 RepID=A0A1M6T6J7_9CLOT|nr:Cache 3/Cache 2 fusion domain-containing protein [Clostridium cavendishii]SHK52593.1 Signal transduction histidine kinase [Clostridium cavendishii DSM 21758]